MNLDPIHLFAEMPWAVRAVVIVLVVQAVLSISVVIDRYLLLFRSGRKSRAFAEEVTPKLDEGDFEAALEIASKTDGSHLASYMFTGIDVFVARRAEGKSVEKAVHLTERALSRHGERVSASLNRGMNVLASTGSTAPFVGLLGTVLGILYAFKMIAETGSGGIATIGAAIGEALVVTGLGLLVAIPVVLVFNALSNKIGLYEAGLANSAGELVDQLESAVQRKEADDVAETAQAESMRAPKKTKANGAEAVVA